MGFWNQIFEAGRKLDQSLYQKLGIDKVAEAIRPKLPPSLARFGGKYGPVLAVVALIALSAVALSGTTGLNTATARNKAGQQASQQEAAASAAKAEAAAEATAASSSSGKGAAKGGQAAGARSAIGGVLATGRGVTDSTITIGVIIFAGFADINRAFSGTDCPGCSEDGVNQKQAQAFIDHINAHGGVAKRKVVPIYHEIDLRNPETFDVFAQQACVDFTEDHKVFAVIDIEGSGIYEQQLITCLAKRDTPRIGYTEMDQKFADDYAPYFYAPSWLNLTRGSRALTLTLVKHGFFEGAKIGLLRYDDAGSERAAEQGIKRPLAANGLKLTSEVAASYPQQLSDLSVTAANASSAVLRFRSDGVTHVLIQDRKVLTGLFLQEAEGQRYYPWYGLNSMSGIGNYEPDGRYDESVKRVRGVGWQPGPDTHASREPSPNATRQLCIDIMKKAGLQYPEVDEKGLSYCDNLFFFKMAGDSAKALTTAGFQAAVEGLGTRFEPPITHTTRFGPGFHDGASTVRRFALDPACGCFQYVGGLEPIEP